MLTRGAFRLSLFFNLEENEDSGVFERIKNDRYQLAVL